MKKISKEEALEIAGIFLNDIQTVVLSTVNKESQPFASYSPFVEDEKGNFYVFISTAVPHSYNMHSTGKAHLLFIEDESKAEHIYARKRMYFKAKAEKFEENDERFEAIYELFKKKFGDAVSFFSHMKDSRFYKLTPSEGNIVLGFGAAYKLSADRKTIKQNDQGHSTSHEEGLKKYE